MNSSDTTPDPGAGPASGGAPVPVPPHLLPRSPERIARWHILVLAAVVLAIAIMNALWAERIRVGEGLGWDGQRFARVVVDPRGTLAGVTTDKYTAQRVVPPLIVSGLLAAVDAPAVPANIVRGFMVYNTFLLVIGALVWGAIARSRGLSLTAFVFGGIALFVNVANIKQLSFYAVMTDMSAFVLGLLVFLAHTRRSTPGLFACALVGAFTWPVALPLIVPLLLWPRETGTPSHDRPTALGTLIAAGTVAGVVAGFAYIYIALDRRTVGYGPVAPVVSEALPITIPLFALIVFFGLRELLRGADWPYARRLITALTPARVGIAVLAIVLARLGIEYLTAPTREPVLPITTFIGLVVFTPLSRPLMSIIAHVTYFGPWVLLLALLWGPATAFVRSEGAGLIAFVSGAFILGFLPESRQTSFMMPVLAVITVLVAEARRVPTGVYVLLGVAAIALSKFWQRFGTGHTFSDLAAYFNNHGIYMAHDAYIPHALVTIALGLGTFALLRRSRGARSVPESLPG